MRLHTKLILGLLAISLLPMGIMGYAGKSALEDVGRDLSGLFSNILLDNTEFELTRLVEDHAQVLRRERMLLQTALRSRVAELESLTTSPEEGLDPSLCSETPAVLPEGADAPYCAITPNGECRPLEPDFDAATRFPDRQNLTTGSIGRLPLAPLLPQMKHMFAELSGMMLWLTIHPVDGPILVYPATRASDAVMPMALTSSIAPDTCEIGGPRWSSPVLDPITRQFVLTVSMGYRDLRSGVMAGVVSLAVPMHNILHENKHVRALSDDVVSMIVRAEGDPPALRVVARERNEDDAIEEIGDMGMGMGGMGGMGGWGPGHMGPGMGMGSDLSPATRRIPTARGRHGRMPGWTVAPKDEYVPVSDPDGYTALIRDIQRSRAGVIGMSFREEASFWAYAPLNTTRGSALLLILPKDDVTRQADTAQQYVSERIMHQLRLTGIGLVMLFALVLLTAWLLARPIALRVDRLTRAVRRVAQGDFTARAEIDGGDEIEELGRAFDRMVPALEDRVRLRHSVGLAQEIQQNLLPAAPPCLPGLDLAGAALYSDETGGDLYDFVRFFGVDAVVGIAVGDVSGHGVPAALLMASARAALRSRLVAPGWAAEAVTGVNRLIARDTASTGHFLTLFYLEIDMRLRRASWVRAGHDPALVICPASGQIHELDSDGVALGLDPAAVFVQEERDLIPGQIVVLGTDGIWETRSPDGEMYGKQRFREILLASTHMTAADIIEAVLQHLSAFRGEHPQEDDITLVVAKLAPDDALADIRPGPAAPGTPAPGKP